MGNNVKEFVIGIIQKHLRYSRIYFYSGINVARFFALAYVIHFAYTHIHEYVFINQDGSILHITHGLELEQDHILVQSKAIHELFVHIVHTIDTLQSGKILHTVFAQALHILVQSKARSS
jgi:hypothetical protein